jgi:hypothetical protein
MSGVEIRKRTPLADLDLSILSCSTQSLCEIEAIACPAGIEAWESMCQLHGSSVEQLPTSVHLIVYHGTGATSSYLNECRNETTNNYDDPYYLIYYLPMSYGIISRAGI